jgi:hypothetical protein
MERELAKCLGFDIGVEDHGMPYMFGQFDYEDSGRSQGFGYCIDTSFLMRFLAVFGVEKLQQVNGKSCWVTHDISSILKVEPLHKREGRPFDLKEWVKTRGCQASAWEMLTGENPEDRNAEKNR